MRTSRSPARVASSTTYWMAGLSTTGSISFGVALVAGRKRVPRPAAGITALVTAPREGTDAVGCSVEVMVPTLVGRSLAQYDLVTSQTLGPVDGAVRRPQQRGGRPSLLGPRCHADADSDHDRSPVHLERLVAHGVPDLRGRRHCFCRVGLGTCLLYTSDAADELTR